jgi:hypothetical protein
MTSDRPDKAVSSSTAMATELLRLESRSSRDAQYFLSDFHNIGKQANSTAPERRALHALRNGSTYLYIEQQQFGRLAILDVTDPAHVKGLGVARLDISAPFDFVRPMGDSAELVCFRGNGRPAVLNLQHPKQPTLTSVNGLRHVASTEPLGITGFLLLNSSKQGGELIAADYQILDTSSPNSPRLLATVTNVQQRLTNQMTGAVYLLGSDGLTIVRRPRVEEENDTEAMAPTGEK